MSRGTVTFIIGLRGVGKTYFRKTDEKLKSAYVIDLKPLYRLCPDGMDKYEQPTWVKTVATAALAHAVYWHENQEEIVVECTGLSKTSQAFIAGLLHKAYEFGYKVEIIYLKPTSASAFKAFIKDDQAKLGMFQAVYSGHPRWRDPNKAPYLPAIKTIEIDHAEAMQDQEYLEAARERLEGARVAQGG